MNKPSKLKSCLYCGNMFDSKWQSNRNRYVEYCPSCTKQHIWWKKDQFSSRNKWKDYRVSDEGVIIYENS